MTDAVQTFKKWVTDQEAWLMTAAVQTLWKWVINQDSSLKSPTDDRAAAVQTFRK